MNKKNRTLITSVASLMMFIPAMVSCSGNNNKAVHEHAFYPVAAKEATCVSAGNIAYDQCIYCKQIEVDGQTVDNNESAILPIEPNGHHFEELAYKAPTCGAEGYKAHMECTLCHKSFIDGEEVSKDSIVIPATKEHVYDENGADNVCKKAFKFDNQVFDENNAYSMSPCSQGKEMESTQIKS